MFLRLRMDPLVAPSVKVDLCNVVETNTPVAALRQPQVYFGFPSGRYGATQKTLEFQCRRDVVSATESGFIPKAVNHSDTRFFRQFAAYVTRFCESSAEIANRNFSSAAVSSPTTRGYRSRARKGSAAFFLSHLGYEVTSR